MTEDGREVHGQWWVPGDRDEEALGSLTIDPEGRTKLTVYGPLGLDPEMRLVDVLRGVASRGQPITLQGLSQSDADWGVDGQTVLTFDVLRAYQGVGTDQPEETSVKGHWFHLDHWTEWVRQRWVDIETDSKERTTVARLEVPEDQSFRLDEETTLTIRYLDDIEATIPQVSKTLAGRAAIHIDYHEPRRLGDVRGDWLPWATYLYLATTTACQILDEGFVLSEGAKNVVSLAAGSGNTASPPRPWMRGMFSPQDLTDGLGDSLRSWHAFADRARPILEAYMTYLDGRLYSTEKFLILAQALDGYSSLRLDRKKRSKEKLREMQEALEESALSSSDAETLYNLAAAFNHLSYKERLIELMNRHAGEMNLDEEEIDARAKQLRDTRNKHVHARSSAGRWVAQGEDFQRLTNFSYILLSLTLATEARVDPEVRSSWARQQLEGFETYVLPG